MIEVSLTEVFLFTWAIIATGFAVKGKHDKDMVMKILQHFIENEGARTEILESYEQFKKRNKA